MQTFVVLAAILALAAAAPQYHDTLDDNFDFTKLTTEQIGGVALCFLDQAPCNDLLNSYKKHYPVAIKEACAHCSPSQKQIALVYFGRLSSELPELFVTLKKRFDPEGIYFDNFMASLRQ